MAHTNDPNDPRLREVNPNTGLQAAYLVLSDEERAKGFVQPVRTTYFHVPCGSTTTMSRPLAETYARDPSFYGGTYCARCRDHFALDQFVWVENGVRTPYQVGSSPVLPSRAPDLEGPAGRAWKVDRGARDDGKANASVEGWILNLPRANPVGLWSWFSVELVHLRPVEGVPPATVTVEGATHELLALARKSGNGCDPDDPTTWGGVLRPFDLVRQFRVEGDEAAVEVLRGMVEGYVRGQVVPDSDRRLPQERAVDELAAHWRGEHAAGDA